MESGNFEGNNLMLQADTAELLGKEISHHDMIMQANTLIMNGEHDVKADLKLYITDQITQFGNDKITVKSVTGVSKNIDLAGYINAKAQAVFQASEAMKTQETSDIASDTLF